MRCSSYFQICLLTLSALLLSPVPQAAATSFVLYESAAPGAPEAPLSPLGASLAASVGETFTVVIGLDDVDEVFSYTLDIQVDPSELAFVGSTQLACKDLGGGLCEAPAFFVDPGAGLGGGATGRASVLSSSVLYADGRRNLPVGTNGPPGFFSLTFQVLAGLTSDGAADLTIGFLDAQADGITGSDLFGDPFPVTPNPDRISLSVVPVPEPSTFTLTTLGLLGLSLRRRTRQREACAAR
jgi:hypothetical protein